MRLQVALALLTLLLFPARGIAEQAPDDATLKAAVAGKLPPYWAVGQLRVTATVNSGDAVEPRSRQRFEAVVAPTADLFLTDASAAETYAPFIPLLPTLSAGSGRTLYGISTASFAAGAWLTDLKLENGVDGLGRPVDLYAAPVVVRGGEAEAKLRDRMATDQVERFRAELAVELERLRGDRAAALAAFAAEQRLEADRLKAEHSGALANQQAEFTNAERALAAKLAAAARDFEAALGRLRDEHQTKLADLRREQEGGLAEVRLAHETELKRLEADRDQTVARASVAVREYDALIEAEARKQSALARLLDAQRITQQQEQGLSAERQQAELAAMAQRAAGAEEMHSKQAEIAAAQAAATAKNVQAVAEVIRGKDTSAAVAALNTPLGSTDETLRASALSEAADSELPLVRRVAAKSALASSKRLGVEYKAKTRKEEFSGTLNIQIAQYAGQADGATFSGTWEGVVFKPYKNDSRMLSGSLSGDTLTAGNRNCSLTAQLVQGGRFEGTMDCGEVATPTGRSDDAKMAVNVAVY